MLDPATESEIKRLKSVVCTLLDEEMARGEESFASHFKRAIDNVRSDLTARARQRNIIGRTCREDTAIDEIFRQTAVALAQNREMKDVDAIEQVIECHQVRYFHDRSTRKELKSFGGNFRGRQFGL